MKKKLIVLAFVMMSMFKVSAQTEPFIGDISIVAFPFAPKGWALCNGQLLPIAQNQVLFSLLGTTYGGNGTTNFALPNLQGRVPIGYGDGYQLGEMGGEYAHTLTMSELPVHSHGMPVNSVAIPASSTSGTTNVATGNYYAANGARGNEYATTPNAKGGLVTTGSSVTNIGGSQAHNNQKPYITVYYIIALQGVYPFQN